ncbi:hypothetical protein FRC10_001655 [Ceratobasidium sp. 414]|nr:hypothetical protein FRC10_001655 [Ceratobasidium sp. 414]
MARGESMTAVGRDQHLTLCPICNFRHKHFINGKKKRKRKRKAGADAPVAAQSEGEPPTKRPRTDENTSPIAGPSISPPVAGPSTSPIHGDGPAASNPHVADRGDGVFVEAFPVGTAGTPIGTRQMSEEEVEEYLKSCGRLGEPDLLDTAEILMTTGLTGRGRTTHLKGPMYKWKGKGKAVWKDNAELMRDIDGLPKRPKWATVEVTVGEGKHRRTHKLYMRDVLEVVRELLGARRFKRWMRYAPERHWTTEDQKHRVYDEMWSGDWWWRTQYLIGNSSGTVVPLIISSDETTLANNPRGPKGHPIYLSLGNISKSIRRRPTKHAMILIGYIPVDSFEEVANDETRKRYRGELLHRSLEKIFEPLKTASSDGILAWCADGNLRHVYPIIAAWLADWPEQNEVACTTQSGCPKCTQEWKGRGRLGPRAPLRDHDAVLEAVHAYQRTKNPAVLQRFHLKPVKPFWADIPHVDIGSCLAPDQLHQLYKGLFEHARDWAEELLGTEEFNKRFKRMPAAQDLRHFKNGVTTVKNWAGRESRDMVRQLLSVVIDAQAPEDFVRMIRALLDFSYLAHGAQLTDVELTEMDRALLEFHSAKDVLVRMKMVKNSGSFDRIAKLHMLGHWIDDTHELGTPDGYSTETPEHLHIIYAKIPWRMSNRRNPFPQMFKFVQRLEAIQIQRTIMDECYGERKGADEEEMEAARMFAEEDEGTEGCSNSDGDDNSSEHGSEHGGEDGEDSNEETVDAESEQPALSDKPYYPQRSITIARAPTARHVPGHVLIKSYGTADLIRAVRAFLSARTGEEPLVLPSDRFDVWHKATINYLPLPFTPSEPCHRDVVRVHPMVRDQAGRIKDAGVFDTALFAFDRNGFGLARK